MGRRVHFFYTNELVIDGKPVDRFRIWLSDWPEGQFNEVEPKDLVPKLDEYSNLGYYVIAGDPKDWPRAVGRQPGQK